MSGTRSRCSGCIRTPPSRTAMRRARCTTGARGRHDGAVVRRASAGTVLPGVFRGLAAGAGRVLAVRLSLRDHPARRNGAGMSHSYDFGGLITSELTILPATLAPMVTLNAEQIAAYQRAIELVSRWDARDATSLPDPPP